MPDAILVGGTAAALYASHRESHDHDHVLADLSDRFEFVLEAIERTEGWITNRVVPYKLILGELGDIETGIRQLIRRRPLEIAEVTLPSGRSLRVPTLEETLRIKAYLVVAHNQTRDFLDVAALTDTMGTAAAATTLLAIDEYYADQHGTGDGVATQLLRQLSEPDPADSRTTRELDGYKRLNPRWHDWTTVVHVCRNLAAQILEIQAGSANQTGGEQ